MHYYLKTRACTDNPAHHALHEFNPTIRDLYLPRPNGRGGMTRTLTQHMSMIQRNTTSLREWVNVWSLEKAQSKFREYHDAQGPHDEVYTDGSKINERVGAAAVVNRHFQDGETTCCQLSKRPLDNSTIFAAETTVITLVLDYYRHMDPVQHDVVFYLDSMSCLQAIEGKDTENPLICHIEAICHFFSLALPWPLRTQLTFRPTRRCSPWFTVNMRCVGFSSKYCPAGILSLAHIYFAQKHCYMCIFGIISGIITL